MRDWSRVDLLGCTRDDAVGEAFDKCAKLLGLEYPGGPALDRLADGGNESAVSLPSPLADPGSPEFSFSGLKTAASLAFRNGVRPEDLAAAFRRVVVDLLVSKTFSAARRENARTVVVAGGVAANSLLREELRNASLAEGIGLYLPRVELATDNAEMVGRAALRLLRDDPGVSTGLDCNAFARWEGTRLETHVPN
jgi:N6-L-threonylcarbamoyladenine synthase